MAVLSTELRKAIDATFYNFTIVDNNIRTKMNNGVTRVRRKTTKTLVKTPIKMYLTSQQLLDLINYFDNTLKNLSLPIVTNDPISGNIVDMNVVGGYKYKLINKTGDSYYEVVFNVEYYLL